jgi:hypothetical protein
MTRDGFFYGCEGTPFADAANAWFWTLDCLEAREAGSKGCGSLRIGRPCEPDDIVNAMRRLDLPAVHSRTVVAWGKRREEPPKDTDARRLWDEAMARLTKVLQAKGIVCLNTEAAGLALIDAIARMGEGDAPAAAQGTFSPDFRMIVGTGGSRARASAKSARFAAQTAAKAERAA